MQFKNVTVSRRADLSHDGRVASRTVVTAEGEMKALGVMQAGTYRFSTQGPETFEITQGHCRMKRADEQTWSDYEAGERFTIPPNTHFEIEVEDYLDYVCHYDET